MPRAAIDALEPRRLLTTYVIDTTVDGPLGLIGNDGLISLREALAAATTDAPVGDAPAGSGDGDVVRFSEALAGQTVVVDRSQPQLGLGDGTQLNVGGPVVTIDAASTPTDPDRKRVLDVGEAALANLILLGGAADIGGGLTVRGNTTLDGVTVRGNFAADTGGGIFHNEGDLTIRNSVISGNVAGAEVAGAGTGNALAGGIFSSGSPEERLTITDSRIEGNVADVEGGGLLVGGPTVASIIRSAIDGNRTLGGGENGAGGGILLSGAVTFVILDSAVTNNVAGSVGGGIWVHPGATVNVLNSDVYDNLAGDHGGGVYSAGGRVTVSSSKVLRNTAGFNGGAIFVNGVENEPGELTLFLSEFSDNVAGAVESPGGPGRQLGNGGGLFLTGAADADIDSCRFQRNVASRLGDGGGIWMAAEATVSINMTLVAENDASGSGGGVFNDGGALTFPRSRAWDNAAGSAVDDEDDPTDPQADGGGLYLGSGRRADVSVSSIARNTTPRHGGGIFNDTQLRVNFTAVNDNVAGSDGGGIFNDDDADPDLVDVFLFGNVPNDVS